MKKGVLVALVVLGVAAVGAGWYFLDYAPNAAEPLVEEPIATTTPSGTATSTAQTPPRDFAAYPVHDIPAGAKVIDKYFYTLGSHVYLNSIQSTSSAVLQNIFPESFKKLTAFNTLPDPAVALDCVRPGEYAFYADSKQLFFYQIWLNSKFKHHEIRAVKDAKPGTLKVLNASSFETNLGTHTISYRVASTSCEYVITLEQ